MASVDWRLLFVAGMVCFTAACYRTEAHSPNYKAAASFARLQVEGGSDYDAGVIPPGQALTHSFTLRNPNAVSVVIVDIQKSCQCTEILLSEKVLPPGATTTLSLLIEDTILVQGLLEVSARLRSTDSGPASVACVTIVAFIGGHYSLRVEPDVLELVESYADGTLSASFHMFVEWSSRVSPVSLASFSLESPVDGVHVDVDATPISIEQHGTMSSAVFIGHIAYDAGAFPHSSVDALWIRALINNEVCRAPFRVFHSASRIERAPTDDLFLGLRKCGDRFERDVELRLGRNRCALPSTRLVILRLFLSPRSRWSAAKGL
jgi:hypothetical protein